MPDPISLACQRKSLHQRQAPNGPGEIYITYRIGWSLGPWDPSGDARTSLFRTERSQGRAGLIYTQILDSAPDHPITGPARQGGGLDEVDLLRRILRGKLLSIRRAWLTRAERLEIGRLDRTVEPQHLAPLIEYVLTTYKPGTALDELARAIDAQSKERVHSLARAARA